MGGDSGVLASEGVERWGLVGGESIVMVVMGREVKGSEGKGGEGKLLMY